MAGRFANHLEVPDYGINRPLVANEQFKRHTLGVALDPGDPDIVYAGPNPGGVYKTMDGGVTWDSAAVGLPAEDYADTLALQPGTPTTLFAGTPGSGLFMSTDAAAEGG